jgi:hypothetical protein
MSAPDGRHGFQLTLHLDTTMESGYADRHGGLRRHPCRYSRCVFRAWIRHSQLEPWKESGWSATPTRGKLLTAVATVRVGAVRNPGEVLNKMNADDANVTLVNKATWCEC